MIVNQNAFPEEGRFYRGNLHCHSTLSDGKGTPVQRVEEYKDAGYDFLALTDHNYYSNFTEFNDDDFLLLLGTELDCPPYGDESLGYHIVGIALPGQNTIPTGKVNAGKTVDEQIAYLNSHGNIAIAAHPYWLQMRSDAYCRLDGVVGLEVFNSLCQFDFGTGFSEHIADEAIYAGQQPLLFATDDYHWEAFRDVPDHFRGYIMVKASALTHEAIVNAILSGSFYATFDGPEILRYEIRDDRVVVDTSPCHQICLRSPRTVGAVRSSYTNELTHAEFLLQGNEICVRVVAIDEYGHTSWTQILPVIPE